MPSARCGSVLLHWYITGLVAPSITREKSGLTGKRGQLRFSVRGENQSPWSVIAV